jgi:cell division protein FtsN
MSEFDRGAYTPQTDSPLSFDARVPRRGGGRPVPMTLIISAVVLAVLIVALVLFYRSGVRGAGEAPQPVGVPVAAMKAAPTEAEQPVDPAAGLQVYKAETPQGVDTPPTFTPGPEQPAPRPATPVAAVPQPQPAAAPQAVAPLRQTAPAAVATTALPPRPAVAKPAAVVAAKPVAAKPVPVKAVPAPRPLEQGAASVIMKAPAVVKPAPKPAQTPVLAKAAAGGSAMIQIGAFSSAALADKGWSDIAKAFPGQMAGKTKAVEPVQKDTGTLFRTSIGGFASKADASAFCASLKATGKTCFVKGG